MRVLSATALTLSLLTGVAHATDIDFYFPVAVQGKLSTEMQRLVGVFNQQNPDVQVTAVFTGSYDDTNLKTRAAIAAGHPPGAAIMSANFIREYVINDQAEKLDALIAKDGQTNSGYMQRFWPALWSNAMEDGHVYGVPFQNSTPILYYNVDEFKAAGLDPDHPPATWQEWVDAARKLTKRDGSTVTQYGLTMISSYDTGGWVLSGLAMSSGATYYDRDWGGEVYYTAPGTLAAMRFMDNLVHRYQVMAPGVTDANAAANAFFTGKAAMLVNSTGALGFMRDNMKTPFRVAFVPRNIRNAVPIGGGSLIIPKGNSPERQQAAWKLISYLTSLEVAGSWSRFTGYFAPNKAAYDLPEMKDYIAKNPDAKVAIDQLAYAQPWFATYDTVAVRKAIEDQMQAVLSGRVKPEEAVANAQKAADALLKPYVDQTAMKLPE